MWAVSFTPWPLCPGGEAPKLIEGGWVGPRAGLSAAEKAKFSAPVRNRMPVVQAVD